MWRSDEEIVDALRDIVEKSTKNADIVQWGYLQLLKIVIELLLNIRGKP